MKKNLMLLLLLLLLCPLSTPFRTWGSQPISHRLHFANSEIQVQIPKTITNNKPKSKINIDIPESPRAYLIKSNENKDENSKKTSIEATLDNPAFWRAMILVVTILWSTNFAVIKGIYAAVPTLDPSLYSAVRMTFAGLVFLPFTLQKISNVDLVSRASLIGIVISLGYVGQGIGLETSTAGKAAFICTLQVVWVALVTGFREKHFQTQTWISVALALIGTGFIELYGSNEMVVGDAWLLLQPLGFGSGYLFLENVIKDYPEDALAITGFKLLGVAICMDLWATFNGHTFADIQPILDSPTALSLLGYTGVVTTAFSIWLQSVSFKRVSAQDASIIIASEPVWAVLVGYILLGEVLTNNDLIGGALITLAGVSYEMNIYDRIKNKLGWSN